MSSVAEEPEHLTLRGEHLSEARHNLRTPINHILGYGEMLLEDASDQGDESLAGELRQILENGKTALGVINGVLSPSIEVVGCAEIHGLCSGLQVPVNHILDAARRIEPACQGEDVAKIRAAAERLLTMAAEILTPVAPHVHSTAAQAAGELKHTSAAAVAPERKAAAHGRLLVVDDNDSNRDVLSRRLEREGYQVETADGGRRALEMARAGKFDLLLLDLMMPEIDGYQVLTQMKADEALREIPVIMISALDEIQSVVRCIEAGAEDYLNKPFDPVLLRARVGASLDRKRLRDEQKRAMEESESLLRNILPKQIADELRTRGQVGPRYFEDVTILFSDFVGFTRATEELAAEDLVHLLHTYFSAFDRIVEKYNLEKLKTIGDSYMLAGGLPERNPSHPVDAVMAAFEMVKAVEDLATDEAPWRVRIGIHTGPVIAGVVGFKKFAFDVWGETVNFSSRMESAGAPNRVNLSGRTYSRVKDFFDCENRGQVTTKEGKAYDMHFAKGILPKLIDDGTQSPPPAFVRRYRIYFQKNPPAFPEFLLR